MKKIYIIIILLVSFACYWKIEETKKIYTLNSDVVYEIGDSIPVKDFSFEILSYKFIDLSEFPTLANIYDISSGVECLVLECKILNKGIETSKIDSSFLSISSGGVTQQTEYSLFKLLNSDNAFLNVELSSGQSIIQYYPFILYPQLNYENESYINKEISVHLELYPNKKTIIINK